MYEKNQNNISCNNINYRFQRISYALVFRAKYQTPHTCVAWLENSETANSEKIKTKATGINRFSIKEWIRDIQEEN